MSSSESEEYLSSSEEISEKESEEDTADNISEAVKQVARELLEARGYSIYRDFHTDNYSKIIGKKEENVFLQILFVIDQKLNVEPLNKIIKYLIDSDIKHCILVHTGNNVSAKVLEIAHNLLILKIKLEFFPYCNLRFNITKHELVPKHELVMGKEAQELKKKFGKFLTVILSTDPVSRFHGFNKGDIIKIYRKDQTIVYRRVL
jgi:DNA-directed RNA polymerase I, II, and III subunit RPABC1